MSNRDALAEIHALRMALAEPSMALAEFPELPDVLRRASDRIEALEAAPHCGDWAALGNEPCPDCEHPMRDHAFDAVTVGCQHVEHDEEGTLLCGCRNTIVKFISGMQWRSVEAMRKHMVSPEQLAVLNGFTRVVQQAAALPMLPEQE